MIKNRLALINFISQVIFDKKGFNILALDLQKVSSFTDYIIIAEGHVDRHVQALAKEIVEKLKERGIRPWRVEGMEAGDWVVLDYQDMMIHLFMPGMREKYQLEKLWKEGEIVDLKIEVEKG